jgi:hypothetical protein
MKRAHDTMELPPSPESSEQEDLHPLLRERRKRSRDYSTVNHDFNLLMDDCVLKFINGSAVERKKFRPQGKPLVLIFYGIMNDYLDGINDQLPHISQTFNTIIIGVSSNITDNEYDFPLIDSSEVVKKFNVLDPIGGGIYPRDVMFIFDRFGKQKHEIPIKHMNRFVHDRPVVDILIDALEDVTSEMRL